MSETERCLGNALQTPLDGIARAPVIPKAVAVEPGDIVLNAVNVFENAGQTVGGVVLRTHAAGPGRFLLATAASQPAPAGGQPAGRAARRGGAPRRPIRTSRSARRDQIRRPNRCRC